ncbi:Glucitol operon repressor [Roseobacter fucihabitans]|uniref:Glucitol operon repressor n=2 Tax=Roseobacter fucihabitans TaxID=1537242 RepID=A0ABZ2BRP8_9RHOB|nr:Glucitol operon repressor [Roseobacter litoralis]
MKPSENTELAAVRRRRIAEQVVARGAMTLRELCDHFGVSDATMRRDLQTLEEGGRIARTHGGAIKTSSVLVDLPNEQRKSIGADEKRRIGRAAINLLRGDEVVFLDAGTTAHAVAVEAARKPACTYVTTSLGIANTLQSLAIDKFYLIGGSYEPINDSFAGSLAVAALRALSFDVAFICCSAIDLESRSISVASEAYSQVQKEVMSISRKNYVIADASKFRSSAFMRTATFSQISGVITNRELGQDSLDVLRETDLDLVLA